jgi:hypothetical protein
MDVCNAGFVEVRHVRSEVGGGWRVGAAGNPSSKLPQTPAGAMGDDASQQTDVSRQIKHPCHHRHKSRDASRRASYLLSSDMPTVDQQQRPE